MADQKKGGKGGGARKYGKKRDQPAMARYTGERRHDANKARRIARMMRRFPKRVDPRTRETVSNGYQLPAGWMLRSNGNVMAEPGRTTRADRRKRGRR